MEPLEIMSLRSAPPRSQRGAGLIEVLVAVLVMGIGLLGVAAMQATALRNNQSALERTQATIQTYSILDAMRANRQRAIAGDYNMTRTCTVPATGATLALKDIHAWFADMQNTHSMGNTACASIVQNGNQFVVTVDWDDSRGSNNTETAPAALQDGIAARNRVVTAVRI
ncbi:MULTISPECIES: type IV pilus modification protein PilV [unclassified Pseudoxanthomonas]|uniref:type IV pilus modification protein PilV n=1 Tax=unclassified Pseudoxanthomonas TaxID=2645906 RepID=UPI0008F19C76|nr:MULTISPECIES: type IV pilus modification protein PilV [unclassified Pseudoxanthomonas]SFV35524.1 type IV pilus assembly protein PilV [Pseudoxanthomonas sp. YR558]